MLNVCSSTREAPSILSPFTCINDTKTAQASSAVNISGFRKITNANIKCTSFNPVLVCLRGGPNSLMQKLNRIRKSFEFQKRRTCKNRSDTAPASINSVGKTICARCFLISALLLRLCPSGMSVSRRYLAPDGTASTLKPLRLFTHMQTPV